jgi:hypothetical protein
MTGKRQDVFIARASEDKETFVRPPHRYGIRPAQPTGSVQKLEIQQALAEFGVALVNASGTDLR